MSVSIEPVCFRCVGLMCCLPSRLSPSPINLVFIFIHLLQRAAAAALRFPFCLASSTALRVSLSRSQ